MASRTDLTWYTVNAIGLAGGVNTYGHVGAVPLSLIDPDGLAACTALFPDYPIEYANGKTINCWADKAASWDTTRQA